MSYRIQRYYSQKPGPPRTRLAGLTLGQARKHCGNPETSSSTCVTEKAKRITAANGPWFDAYTKE